MATTRPSQTSQETGAGKIRKGRAARTKRDNDQDNDHNTATLQESRDRYEHTHFHADGTPDIERSQASARAQAREEARENGKDDPRSGSTRQREYSHADSSHYNDDDRAFQTFSDSGGNRSGSGRGRGHYAQMGHGANRRPESQPDSTYDDRLTEGDRRWREDDRGHYDGNRAERDRYELNDRQNGWQANVRVDNRDDDRRRADDERFNNNWRDRQWRETAYSDRAHPWRENDDWRNEQRNGSEYDRDRGSYGNSRFRDDDYGYRTSRHDARDYGRTEAFSDTRQPRGYSATSERDYEDRNPSREWARDPEYPGRDRHR